MVMATPRLIGLSVSPGEFVRVEVAGAFTHKKSEPYKDMQPVELFGVENAEMFSRLSFDYSSPLSSRGLFVDKVIHYTKGSDLNGDEVLSEVEDCGIDLDKVETLCHSYPYGITFTAKAFGFSGVQALDDWRRKRIEAAVDVYTHLHCGEQAVFFCQSEDSARHGARVLNASNRARGAVVNFGVAKTAGADDIVAYFNRANERGGVSALFVCDGRGNVSHDSASIVFSVAFDLYVNAPQDVFRARFLDMARLNRGPISTYYRFSQYALD